MAKIELKKGKRINVRIAVADRHVMAGCPVRVLKVTNGFILGRDQDGEMRMFRRSDFIFEEVT